MYVPHLRKLREKQRFSRKILKEGSQESSQDYTGRSNRWLTVIKTQFKHFPFMRVAA